jgi:hypothetical protein
MPSAFKRVPAIDKCFAILELLALSQDPRGISAIRAIEFYDTPQGKKARVNPFLCKGDGLCNMVCAPRAIVLKHHKDEAILDQIDASVPGEAYVCRRTKREMA